ncbi:hypothetical protein C8Q74DRAFT_224346 [Fomes fomentarius]|nr:hypothetical protein C8Q74DRAFT_224346 [Fomes fomentarius]
MLQFAVCVQLPVSPRRWRRRETTRRTSVARVCRRSLARTDNTLMMVLVDKAQRLSSVRNFAQTGADGLAPDQSRSYPIPFEHSMALRCLQGMSFLALDAQQWDQNGANIIDIVAPGAELRQITPHMQLNPTGSLQVRELEQLSRRGVYMRMPDRYPLPPADICCRLRPARRYTYDAKRRCVSLPWSRHSIVKF